MDEHRNIIAVVVSHGTRLLEKRLNLHRTIEACKRNGHDWDHLNSYAYSASDERDHIRMTIEIGDPYVLHDDAIIRGMFHHPFGVELVTDGGSRIIPKEYICSMTIATVEIRC